MDELTASLAIPVDVVAGRVTPKEFRVRYPKAISALEAHPIAFGLGFALAIVAVVVVIVGITLSAF